MFSGTRIIKIHLFLLSSFHLSVVKPIWKQSYHSDCPITDDTDNPLDQSKLKVITIM